MEQLQTGEQKLNENVFLYFTYYGKLSDSFTQDDKKKLNIF